MFASVMLDDEGGLEVRGLFKRNTPDNQQLLISKLPAPLCAKILADCQVESDLCRDIPEHRAAMEQMAEFLAGTLESLTVFRVYKNPVNGHSDLLSAVMTVCEPGGPTPRPVRVRLLADHLVP